MKNIKTFEELLEEKYGKKDIHNSVSVSDGNEYSMFTSINANEEKLDDKIFYYYPNATVKIEKFTIHPEKPSFYLDFYKNNLNKYQEICHSVKLLMAINSSLTKYTTSTGNIVKIKCENKEKKCSPKKYAHFRMSPRISRINVRITPHLQRADVDVVDVRNPQRSTLIQRRILDTNWIPAEARNTKPLKSLASRRR